ncbi:MAG: aldo/keto reductase [Acidobacteriota bacterium]
MPIISMGAVNTNNPALIRAALDAGIVYFDTGYYYQSGRNEEMLGEVLSGRSRGSFCISSKVMGEHEDHVRGTFTDAASPESFGRKFATSLRRLRLDYVDIFFLHNAGSRSSALYEPLLSTMLRFKRDGKARFIGVSTHINEPEVIRAAVESKVYDVVMTAYNFRQPHCEEVGKAIGEAARAGLGVVAMKTQAGVYWDQDTKHPINMKAALKWALKNPDVHTAIPGITTFDQLALDLSVMAEPDLTPEELADLERPGLSGLYCAQCRRCVPQCPYGTDIPTLMRAYMYARGYQDPAAAKLALDRAGINRTACDRCESCAVRCTMGFDVAAKVKDIIRVVDVPDEFLT